MFKRLALRARAEIFAPVILKTPTAATQFQTRRLLCLFFVLLAGWGTSACTFLKIQLGPSVSPLKEKAISEEGEQKVLLVDIQGLISNRKKRTPLGATAETGMVERIREILKKAEKDDEIKALLLRINSPGGTVTSSDIIYHDLKTFKKKKNVKIYAAFMDLAASGGYYIAMAADRIIAHPTSITGSIGVLALKVDLTKLMKKVGVDMEVVKSGDKKDFMSPFRPFTETERKLFQKSIDEFHQRFVETIAKNRRGLDLPDVEALADGRIYNARQALENKLVDQIGYMDDILDFIKKDLGLKEIKTVTYHRSGEYKNNIYSSVSGSPTINLVNIDFSAISMEAPTLFMYLWMP